MNSIKLGLLIIAINIFLAGVFGPSLFSILGVACGVGILLLSEGA